MVKANKSFLTKIMCLALALCMVFTFMPDFRFNVHAVGTFDKPSGLGTATTNVALDISISDLTNCDGLSGWQVKFSEPTNGTDKAELYFKNQKVTAFGTYLADLIADDSDTVKFIASKSGSYTFNASAYNQDYWDWGRSITINVTDGTPTTYTVTYDKNGGDAEADPKTTTNITSGGNVGTLPTAPTKSGYVFDGWNTLADGTGAAFTALTSVTASITVYAKWIKAPTVTTQGVTNITSTTATGNGTITSVGIPSPTDYGFCYGTSANPDILSGTKVSKGPASANGTFTADMTGLTANTTYHVRAYATNSAGTSYGTDAPFTTSALVVTYTVTYDGNTNTEGNVPTDSNSYAEGATVTVLGNTGSLKKTGYAFDGWSIIKDSASGYTGGNTFTMGTSNVTLYAKWTAQTYTITYHNVNGANNPNPTSYTYLAGAVTVVPLTLAGYRFDGWYGEAEYTHLTTSFVNGILGNVNLWAKWTPTYTITGTITKGGVGVGGVTLSYTDESAKTVITNPDGTYTITVPENWSGTVTPSKTNYTFIQTSKTYTPVTANCTDNYTCSTVPGKPTNVTATAENAQATISFDIPTDNGGSAITGYTVTSSPGGITATGTATPITVTGLTNGTAYTFTVTATNNIYTSDPSSASNVVTPVALSSGKSIISTSIGTLSSGNVINVPTGTKVSDLKAGLTVSDGATKEIITGTGGTTVPNQSTTDVTSAMKIKVTAENGDIAEYTITMSIRTGKSIISTSIGTLSSGNVSNVPTGTKVSNFKAGLTVSDGATKEIITGTGGTAVLNQSTTDVTSAMKIKVTAENGDIAEYTITVNTIATYTVTFKYNYSGKADTSATANVGTTYSNFPNPTRSGYTFGGWYNNSNCNGTAVTFVTTTAILYAKWTANSTPTPNGPSTPTPTTTTPAPKTITVIEAPQGITNPELIVVKPEGDAFDQSVEVRLKNDPITRQTVLDALKAKLGESAANAAVFPLDISLYIKGTDTKVQPNAGASVEITCPIPAELLASKDKIVIVCVIDGKMQIPPAKVVFKNGVYCAVFTASHFSPYAFVIDTDGKLAALAAGVGTEDNESPIRAENGLPYAAVIIVLTIGMVVYKKRKANK